MAAVGYQHLSAMGRDPIGGCATNLLPGDKPEDMYLRTSDRVNSRIQRDAEGRGREAQARQGEASKEDAEAARQLLGKIDRSGVKVATMTTPYGVTRNNLQATSRIRAREVLQRSEEMCPVSGESLRGVHSGSRC
jgi:DNA-directed RNA polymerase